MSDSRFQVTHVAGELALDLVRLFGGQDAVPAELKTALWLIHMRLTEAEQDMARLWDRATNYSPGDWLRAPGGDETGDF